MTRDEFVADYAKRSGLIVPALLELMCPLPCACGDDGCKGWQMVSHQAARDIAHEAGLPVRSEMFNAVWTPPTRSDGPGYDSTSLGVIHREAP